MLTLIRQSGTVRGRTSGVSLQLNVPELMYSYRSMSTKCVYAKNYRIGADRLHHGKALKLRKEIPIIMVFYRLLSVIMYNKNSQRRYRKRYVRNKRGMIRLKRMQT